MQSTVKYNRQFAHKPFFQQMYLFNRILCYFHVFIDMLWHLKKASSQGISPAAAFLSSALLIIAFES